MRSEMAGLRRQIFLRASRQCIQIVLDRMNSVLQFSLGVRMDKAWLWNPVNETSDHTGFKVAPSKGRVTRNMKARQKYMAIQPSLVSSVKLGFCPILC